MPPLTCSPGCDSCLNLTRRVIELEQKITTLQQTQENTSNSVVIQGWTFSAATSAQLADMVPFQHEEVTERGSTIGSLMGLGVPNAHASPAAEDDRWVQQGAKPKAPTSSTPVVSGAWSTVASSHAPLPGPQHARISGNSNQHADTPTTLIIGDSIIRNVRMRGELTLSFPGATVKDIAAKNPGLLALHPHVSKVFIHAGTNDINKQQSELLKHDFIHLFNLLKNSDVSVYISGPTPTLDRGIGCFSRLLSLNTWLSSATVMHNIGFIDNFNIFWGRRHLFGADGLHLNRQGTRALAMSLACP
uniref:SGNH hydrolase-type esterase domain-containing protein n=1 Tax=Nothobranchius furzeri TaxID=105023 RepID=A0A8C6LFJ3_NOTFU